jgi:hypothetical protein
LETIRKYLGQLGRHEVVERLQPGLELDQIDTRLANAGLGPSAEVGGLYSWRNGTRVEPGTTLDSVQFFPGFWLLSLDDVVSNYLAFRDDSRWSSGWLPIFANGGGDFYAVDLEQRPSPVIGFMVDSESHPVEYESLAHMLDTLAECFAEGAFFVDDQGNLEMDDSRHAQIARRNNPGVPLWSEDASSTRQ